MSFNPYKLLRELIPQAPLMVGTVKSLSGGVATIEIQGGGICKARSADTIKTGDSVFFRDGVVEAKAPNLPVVNIDI